jgi:hypothetical protein
MDPFTPREAPWSAVTAVAALGGRVERVIRSALSAPTPRRHEAESRVRGIPRVHARARPHRASPGRRHSRRARNPPGGVHRGTPGTRPCSQA